MSTGTVSQVMHEGVLMLEVNANVKDATIYLKEHQIGAIGVKDLNGKLVGMFSERDVVTRVVAMGLDPISTKLEAVMTSKIITVKDDLPVDDALVIMNDKRIRHLPVVNREDQPVGMIGLRDLMQFVVDRTINDFMNS